MFLKTRRRWVLNNQRNLILFWAVKRSLSAVPHFLSMIFTALWAWLCVNTGNRAEREPGPGWQQQNLPKALKLPDQRISWLWAVAGQAAETHRTIGGRSEIDSETKLILLYWYSSVYFTQKPSNVEKEPILPLFELCLGLLLREMPGSLSAQSFTSFLRMLLSASVSCSVLNTSCTLGSIHCLLWNKHYETTVIELEPPVKLSASDSDCYYH